MTSIEILTCIFIGCGIVFVITATILLVLTIKDEFGKVKA